MLLICYIFAFQNFKLYLIRESCDSITLYISINELYIKDYIIQINNLFAKLCVFIMSKTCIRELLPEVV